MKDTNVSPRYFSAYPLKAIPKETTNSKPNLTPYLQALLASQTRSASKLRVFPMVNPYPAGTIQQSSGIKVRREENAKHIEAEQRDWFNHYE